MKTHGKSCRSETTPEHNNAVKRYCFAERATVVLAHTPCQYRADVRPMSETVQSVWHAALDVLRIV